MTRYAVRVYRITLADDVANVEASTLAAMVPANLVLTSQGNDKHDIAQAIMHSGAVDLSPEKDSQGHRI